MTLRQILSQRLHENDICELCNWSQGQRNDHHKAKLYQLMMDEDKRISDNAAWVFTHFTSFDAAWLYDKHDELIDEVMKTTSETKRRLLLNLLLGQRFTKENMRTDFLDFCLERLTDAHEPVGVKAQCMKLAYQQCKPFPELLQELRYTLEMLEPEVHSAGMKSAMRKIKQRL
jgi:hypothetical protein